MTDIFREVDEAVRHDEMRGLWQRYGKYAAVLVGAVLLATAGFSGWREYRSDRRSGAGDTFAAGEALLAEGKAVEAAEVFLALADKDIAAYGGLARSRAAAALVQAGRTDEAVALLDGLAADGDADPFLRAVAGLSAVALLLDTGDVDELGRRLEPLLAEDSPVRDSAGELAGLLALRRGDTAAAADIFRALADGEAVVPGVRIRAQRILATLGAAGTSP